MHVYCYAHKGMFVHIVYMYLCSHNLPMYMYIVLLYTYL